MNELRIWLSSSPRCGETTHISSGQSENAARLVVVPLTLGLYAIVGRSVTCSYSYYGNFTMRCARFRCGCTHTWFVVFWDRICFFGGLVHTVFRLPLGACMAVARFLNLSWQLDLPLAADSAAKG